MTSGSRRLSASSASATSRSVRSRVVLRARCSSAPSSSSGTSHGSWRSQLGARSARTATVCLSLRAAGEPIERIEQRRVRLAGLSRVALRARDEDAPLGEAAQERLHERGLPDPGLSRDEDDPPVAGQRVVEHPAETAELDVTTDETRGVRPELRVAGRSPAAGPRGTAAFSSSSSGSCCSIRRSSSRSRAEGSMPSSSSSARRKSW